MQAIEDGRGVVGIGRTYCILETSTEERSGGRSGGNLASPTISSRIVGFGRRGGTRTLLPSDEFLFLFFFFLRSLQMSFDVGQSVAGFGIYLWSH
jgi:hypothetical protein